HTPIAVPVPVRARSSTPFSDESRPSTPLSGDLRADIKKITDRFFTPGSPASLFLDEYVRSQQALPVTTTNVKGLPEVLRRGVMETVESRPSLLFLDLPVPPSNTNDPPLEKFGLNVLLEELKGMESQDLLVFGVNGCGKTRSVLEMLCLQWGLYFNASKNNLGSDDLSLLAESIDGKVLQEQGVNTNTLFARNRTILLFLSWLLIFNYCLQYQGCRETFSSASWALLQACPNIFRDVFSELFRTLNIKLKAHALSESDLLPIVREEFESVQQSLLAFKYSNFSPDTKLRLVVDEAQILSDRGSTSFRSSSTPTDLRPMLSPVLNGFRSIGGRGELTIIYCGTGLSMRTLHWAMSSGDGVKEEGSNKFPYIEFRGWTGRDSVQSYIDRVKEQLPDSELKREIDTLLPPAAVDMLHTRLTGRFRPIVTEGIIRTGDPTKWETVINNTETMLISWKDRERRGNLCGEITRLEDKISKHPKDFASCSSIKETLGLFLFRHNLLDATEIVLESDVHLVEAAFGRIKLFGGAARTVFDEPFVLKASQNYFQEKDPMFIAAAERVMLSSKNPTDTLSGQLAGHVTIVGHNELEPKLAISDGSITTQEFMKAHVKDNSSRLGEDVPPFYFPAARVSGPDIIFFVRINDEVLPCFVQLKLRQVLDKSDAEEAVALVSAYAVQEKLVEEHEKQQKKKEKQQRKDKQEGIAACVEPKPEPPRLQDYCPTGVYISMVIAYPAEVIEFQVVRPDPEPELEGLRRVSIHVDDSNFAQIFPECHVKFLDKLKKFKRSAEDQEHSNRNKRVKA
ncbi:hypothetical protein EDD11_009178, partial [Mortierella claussenii]